MSPARAKRRHHRSPSIMNNNPHALQLSDADIDLDSDHPNVQTLATQPPINSRTNEELNLSVLQRHNPLITGVLAIAPYAVIYAFSTTAQTWEKTGTEGTLFVCQLQSEADMSEGILRYLILVLNRRGLENFEVELTGEEEVEVTEQFILVRETNRNHGANVDGLSDLENYNLFYGLWIFADPPPSSTAGMREIIAQVIQNCASQAEASRQRSVERKMTATTSLENHKPHFPSGDVQPMVRELSLRELFARERERNANPLPEPVAPPQTDILADLFRNAKMRQQMDYQKS